MTTIRNWMLGAAVVAGGLGMAAGTAQAAEFGIYARGPVAYVPPCPGPGYVWAAGYQANGYWIPGRWNFLGERNPEAFGRFEGDRNHVAYGHSDRDRDRDRHEDRGHDGYRR